MWLSDWLVEAVQPHCCCSEEVTAAAAAASTLFLENRTQTARNLQLIREQSLEQ